MLSGLSGNKNYRCLRGNEMNCTARAVFLVALSLCLLSALPVRADVAALAAGNDAEWCERFINSANAAAVLGVTAEELISAYVIKNCVKEEADIHVTLLGKEPRLDQRRICNYQRLIKTVALGSNGEFTLKYSDVAATYMAPDAGPEICPAPDDKSYIAVSGGAAKRLGEALGYWSVVVSYLVNESTPADEAFYSEKAQQQVSDFRDTLAGNATFELEQVAVMVTERSVNRVIFHALITEAQSDLVRQEPVKVVLARDGEMLKIMSIEFYQIFDGR